MNISKLRHRVLLCRQQDVITAAGGMQVKREGVWSAWSAIEAKKSSMFSPHGASMKDSRNQRTHIVTMRHRPDINVSALAWLYEDRLQSSPRWFKVLAVNETEHKGSRYYMFDVRVTDRGDELAQPATDEDIRRHGPATGLPPGVKL